MSLALRARLSNASYVQCNRITQKHYNLIENKASKRVFYILVFLCCSLQNDMGKDFFKNLKRPDNGCLLSIIPFLSL